MLEKIKQWLKKDQLDLQSAIDKAYDLGMENGSTALYQQWINAKEKRDEDMQESWFVDPEYIFGLSKGGLITLNGNQITTQELKNLKSEIRALKEFEIYKILQTTLRQKAIEKAVLTSTDLYSLKGNEQVLAGKMMVYSLDIIKTIINDIDAAKLGAR